MAKINLPEGEEEFLKEFTSKGTKSARSIKRAYVLLLANKGETEEKIAEILYISRATVSNTKRRYRKEGLESALNEKPRSGQPKKYTELHEAEIIALACTSPPEGRKRWTLELLTEELRKKEGFETITCQSIRLILKKVTQDHG